MTPVSRGFVLTVARTPKARRVGSGVLGVVSKCGAATVQMWSPCGVTGQGWWPTGHELACVERTTSSWPDTEKSDTDDGEAHTAEDPQIPREFVAIRCGTGGGGSNMWESPITRDGGLRSTAGQESEESCEWRQVPSLGKEPGVGKGRGWQNIARGQAARTLGTTRQGMVATGAGLKDGGSRGPNPAYNKVLTDQPGASPEGLADVAARGPLLGFRSRTSQTVASPSENCGVLQRPPTKPQVRSGGQQATRI